MWSIYNARLKLSIILISNNNVNTVYQSYKHFGLWMCCKKILILIMTVYDCMHVLYYLSSCNIFKNNLNS